MVVEYSLLKQLRDELDSILKNNTDANQQKLPEPRCSKCGKQVEQKVVNFCKVRYQGTTYCRKCQEEID